MWESLDRARAVLGSMKGMSMSCDEPEMTYEEIEQEARYVAERVVDLSSGLEGLAILGQYHLTVDPDAGEHFGVVLAHALGCAHFDSELGHDQRRADFLEKPIHEVSLEKLMRAGAACRLLTSCIEKARSAARRQN